MIRKLFSQAGQDAWVIQNVFNFMSGGYFLDIGAAGGIELSNTYALEQYCGWTGICVEADPISHAKLTENRRCTTIKACLAGKPGKVRFATRTAFYGGMIEPGRKDEGIIEIDSITIAQLLLEQNAPRTIHYLTIDVEGAEDDIMSAFPFETHRFLSATIERPGPKLRALLAQNGYLLVAEQPDLDAFYIHNSLSDSYRIHAMDRAGLAALPVWKRGQHFLTGVFKNGLRSSLKRL